MEERPKRKPNKWGQTDWRSNPSEVQTALRGVMALRRRDRARQTSRDSTPTEHQVSQTLLHLSSSLTSLKTFTNSPLGLCKKRIIKACSAHLPEKQNTKCDKEISKQAGDGMLSHRRGHKPQLALC